MEDNEFKQMIEDKSANTKQIMRDINFLCEKLNEAGEVNICGSCLGWEYSFKKVSQNTEKEFLN